MPVPSCVCVHAAYIVPCGGSNLGVLLGPVTVRRFMFALDGSEGCLQTLVLFMVLFMLFVLPCLQVLCKRVQDSSMQARAAAVAEEVAVPPIFTQWLASPMQCPSFFHECCLCCHAHTLVLFVLSCLQGLCKRIQQVLGDSSMHMLELNRVTLWYP